MKKNSTKGFRRQYKNASFVYSQCPVPIDVLDKHLKEKAGNKFGWHLIVTADHDEKTTDTNKHCGVHLHVHEEYSKKPNITNSRHWDIEWEGKVYHPHLEPTISRAGDIKYCLDQETSRVVSGELNGCPVDLTALMEAHQTKQSYGYHWVANQLKEGKTIDDVDDVAQAFVVNNKRKIDEYQVFLQQKKERREIKPLFTGFDDVCYPAWQQIVNWANRNFYSGVAGKMPSREPRQLQLWIYSTKHNIGKSWPWKVTLREYFRCYDWATNGHKQKDSVKDCDYIMFDEFKGGIYIHEFKELAQMYGTNIPIRYGMDIYWKKNVPLIVTSHKTPQEIYTKPEDKDDVESLASRFLIINVDDCCYLHPKEDLIPPTIVIDEVIHDPLGTDLSFRTTNLVLRNSSSSSESSEITRLLLGDSNDDSKDDIDEHSEHSNEENNRRNLKNKKK